MLPAVTASQRKFSDARKAIREKIDRRARDEAAIRHQAGRGARLAAAQRFANELAAEAKAKVDLLAASMAALAAFPMPVSPIERILKHVAKDYGEPPERMKCKQKTADIVEPRFIAIYLAEVITKKSRNEIGMRFGMRTHATIIHACKRVRERMAREPEYRERVERLQDECIAPFKLKSVPSADVPATEVPRAAHSS